VTGDRDHRHLAGTARRPTLCGMTTQTPPQHTHSRGRRTWHLVRHYLEMVVAMVVGMAVLGPVEALLWPGVDDRVDVHAVVMATNMAVAMAAWMRFRGHSWPAIAEMSAAMYVPFAVLLVPYWVGAISGGTLFTAGHVLMLPAMALAMWWRLDEYEHC
jgi:flagellar biosynthetic protein FliP